MIRPRLMTISIVALHVFAAVWVVAVLRPETFRYGTLGDKVAAMLMFDRGQVRFSLWLSSDPPAATGESEVQRYGFGYHVQVNITPTGKVNRMFRVMMPVWALIGLCAFYPAFVFFRGPATRFRRRRMNQCPSCGYSLEGNVSGVCPECGAPTPAAARGLVEARTASSVEHAVWRCLERATSRRGLTTIGIILLLVAGVDLLLDRPWETPMQRVYRLCGADGLSNEDIETALLGFRGGFSPDSALFGKLTELYERRASSPWSDACREALSKATAAAPRPAIPPIPIPATGP